MGFVLFSHCTAIYTLKRNKDFFFFEAPLPALNHRCVLRSEEFIFLSLNCILYGKKKERIFVSSTHLPITQPLSRVQQGCGREVEDPAIRRHLPQSASSPLFCLVPHLKFRRFD